MARKKFVYVVSGSTGSYSDQRDWTVCAFKKKKAAWKYSALCQQEASRLEIKRPESYDPCGSSKFDPFIQMDSNGTTYHVEKVELRV